MTKTPGVTIIHDSYIKVKPVHDKLEVYQADKHLWLANLQKHSSLHLNKY